MMVQVDRLHEPDAIMVQGAQLVDPRRYLEFRNGAGKMVTWSQNELFPEPGPIFHVLQFLEDKVRLEQDLPVLIVGRHEIQDDLLLHVVDLLHEIIGLHSLRYRRMELVLFCHDSLLNTQWFMTRIL